MGSIPFWLHRPLKRLLQYLSVMIAAIPAGVLYLILLKILAPSIAFVIPFPIALALAYFAWHWVGRAISFETKPRVVNTKPSLVTGVFAFETVPIGGVAISAGNRPYDVSWTAYSYYYIDNSRWTYVGAEAQVTREIKPRLVTTHSLGTLAVVLAVVAGGQATFGYPAQSNNARSASIVLEKTNAATDN